MIKLTDEEVEEYCLGGPYQSESYFRDGAKAQLRKVDEAINQFFEREPWMTLKDWQALLEEVK